MGNCKPESIDQLFLSIQTFNSQDFAAKTVSDFYDYIVVDEFHHAAAPTYQKLRSYYQPQILLGLTATPERMDGKSVLPYFNNRIAAEIRLPEAIDRKLLCPFQYFGVTDTVDLNTLKWSAGGYDITDFVDDPRMLNVAVSRAVKSLTVITSQDPQNDRTNYGDLARYIEYNNCAVIESAVYSVFDLLYQGYAEQRRAFLKKHGRVSEYDSENLVYAVIQNMLQKAEFSFVDCAAHVSLVNLVKDYSMLTEEETAYARNPLSHVDFLLFRRMDKSPLLAVEVDGAAFHAAGNVQADRDEKKNRIFEQCNIPLLRLRTDGSGEEERIEQALRSAVSNS